MERILIVEDDTDIAELVSIHLHDMGFETEKCGHGLEALEKVLSSKYELIILDIMLPGMDGFEICKRMRAEKKHTPVLMLTSRSEEVDKILGLELGADDYLQKPFSIRELTARVKAILRRSNVTASLSDPAMELKIEFEDFLIDMEKRLVKVHGVKRDLSPKEFDLLCLLAQNPGKTYTREQLLSTVWGFEYNGFEHTVNSHINRLRTKIERNAQDPEFVLTTWGVGYRFKDNSE